jgi:hypothetical protein
MLSLGLALSLAPLALGLASPNVQERTPDPCAKIGGQTFVPPADALACLKSFPFNETIRQNVMATGMFNDIALVL